MFSPSFITSAWRVASTVWPRGQLRLAERVDVRDAFRCGQFGHRLDKAGEICILRHEVGFAVDFDQRAQLAVGRHVNADRTFGSDPAGHLARLGAALDAQQVLGLLHVAAGFFQRLLAFHHAEPGALAQFLDHACGDFRHFSLAPGSVARLGRIAAVRAW